MSILKVDTINEKTTGNGVHIDGHVVQVQQCYKQWFYLWFCVICCKWGNDINNSKILQILVSYSV